MELAVKSRSIYTHAFLNLGNTTCRRCESSVEAVAF